MSAWEYVYLAVGTGVVGAGSTLILVLVCGQLGIDLVENLWLLTLPLGFSLFFNIMAIEIYRRYRRR